MTVAVVCVNPMSSKSTRSQIASLVAFADAMYSDSTVETDTVGCFFDDQLMELPATSSDEQGSTPGQNRLTLTLTPV